LRRLAHRLLVTTLSASFFVNAAAPARAQVTALAEPAGVAAPAAAPAPHPSAPEAAPEPTPDAEAAQPAAIVVADAGTGSGTGTTQTEIIASVDEPDPKAPKEPDPAPFSGSYTRTLKLELPEFRSLTPHLGALYDSNAGWHAGEFDAGFLGIGWRLDGLSEIRRSGHRGGSPLFDASAVLASDDVYRLDGVELNRCPEGPISVGSASCSTGGADIGNFEARYENDRRIRYDVATNSWRVWDKNGTVSTYRSVQTWASGGDPVPVDIALRFRWRLAEVRDTHGNTVTWSYDCTTLPACWPSRITYGPYEVIFHGEANPTPLRQATGKTVATLDRRLRSIEVNVAAVGSTPATLIKAWRFDHATSPVTGLPRLTGIVEFGDNAVIAADGDVSGSAQPATLFAYSGTDVPTMVLHTSGGPNQPPPVYPTNTSLLFGDFDGDGKTNGSVASVITTNPDLQQYACKFSDVSVACPKPDETVSASTVRFADDSRDAALFRFVYPPPPEGGTWTDTLFAVGHDGTTSRKCDFLPGGYVYGPSTPSTRLTALDYFGKGHQAALLGTTLAYCGRQSNQPAPHGNALDDARDQALHDLTTSPAAPAVVPRAGDVDGDGRDDLVYVDQTPTWDAATSTWRFAVLVARAAGDSWAEGTRATFSIPGTAAATPAWVVGDLDGDGRADILFARRESTAWTALRSTGTGFVQEDLDLGLRLDPTCVLSPDRQDPCLRIVDLDGDGLPEVLARAPVNGAGELRYHLVSSNGSGTTDISWVGAHPFDLPHVVADVDGNGRQDIFAANSELFQPTGRWHGLNGVHPDLLTRVTAPHGGVTTIGYGPSSQWSNTLLRQIRQTVVWVKEDDNRGTVAETTYTYTGGLFDYGERRFLGFRTVVETLPMVGEETVAPTRTYTFRQDLAAAGRVEKLEVKDGFGNLLRTVRHEYATDVRAETATVPAHFIARESAVETVAYDNTTVADATATRTSRTEYAHDDWGNVTQERRYGRLDTDVDDRILHRLYFPNADAYIVGLKGAETLTELVGGVTTTRARVLVYYDGADAASTPPTTGDITRVGRWNDRTDTNVFRDYRWDARGNRIREADETGDIEVADRRTDTVFDDVHHLFPVSATTPANEFGTRLVTTSEWNVGCGKPKKVIDPNGVTVADTTFDHFCRVAAVTKPLGDYETWTYDDDRANGWRSIVATPPATGETTEITTETLYDGLARVIKLTKTGPNPTNAIIVDTTWDARGNKDSETLPHYAPALPRIRTFRFDALARPIVTTEPDGADTLTEYGLSPESRGIDTVSVTDPNGNVAVTHHDAFGRDLRRDRIASATQTAITRITRNALGKVTRIVDPIGAVWTATWDSLGRRVAATDPDLGAWTYAYDDADRLTAQTDARGNVVALAYDALGRLLTRTVTPAGGTAEVTRTVWDEDRTGFANLGRISREASPIARVCHDHDAAGHIVRDRWTLPADTTTPCASDPAGSESFALDTRYDAGGRVIGRTYPDGDEVGTVASPLRYDAAGRLRVVPGLISLITYDASGHTTKAVYLNGVTSTFAYDLRRGWLNTVTHALGTTTLERRTYTHDAGGRITEVDSGSLSGESWTYTYDRLDRLTKATNTDVASRTQSFAYDLGSRFTSATGNGSYTYGDSRPHAPRTVGSDSLSWDAAGNLTAGGGRTFTWDGENRPASIVKGTSTVALAYAPGGERLTKAITHPATGCTGTRTDIVLTLSADVDRRKSWTCPNGTWVQKTEWSKYPHPDVRITGTGATADTFFLHRDHLATVDRVTDGEGVTVETDSYKPYGTRTSALTPGSDGATPARPDAKGFTGERDDPEVGLLYLHARYYDPKYGLFVSPDTWDPLKEGVGTNRYAYAGNDPVNKADRNGHFLGLGAIAVGAIIGAIANAAVNVSAQIAAGKSLSQVDFGQVGIAAASGAVTGAIAGGLTLGGVSLGAQVASGSIFGASVGGVTGVVGGVAAKGHATKGDVYGGLIGGAAGGAIGPVAGAAASGLAGKAATVGGVAAAQATGRAAGDIVGGVVGALTEQQVGSIVQGQTDNPNTQNSKNPQPTDGLGDKDREKNSSAPEPQGNNE